MNDKVKDKLTIALAQMNPVVGDVRGNAVRALAARARAATDHADLVAFPELFLSGYPPEDLVLNHGFIREIMETLNRLATETADGGPAMLIGTPWKENGNIFNSAVLLDAGKISACRHKLHLPNYGVFDEMRVFRPGPMPKPMDMRGVRIGVPICEDIWFPDVAKSLREQGANMLISINGSPFEQDRTALRMDHAVRRVKECGLPLVYLNQCGGQDELVFDGASVVIDGLGEPVVGLPAWREDVRLTQWAREGGGWRCAPGDLADIETGPAALWQAITMGLRDYVNKNGFPGVLLGLSGGIDSALCAAVAVDALGPDRVTGVMLPSRHTPADSLRDATDCAAMLGITLKTIPINTPVAAVSDALASEFDNHPPDVTEENIQSRMRGLLLMGLSNKFGAMLVTTGNKSEVSVGYATLYGDMNGGYNPIKDIYKTGVFALARWRNGTLPTGALGPGGRVIPDSVIDKPPSAELRPDQKDSDSLPPYDVLDDILDCLVEQDMPLADVIARGHPAEIVRQVENLLHLAEYKRRQAPPGVRVRLKNFGRGRRWPITNKFRGAPDS